MTKLPSLPKDKLSVSNLDSVVVEMDNKMKKIAKSDCLVLQAEIEKSIEYGFLIEVKDRSQETQENIWSQPSHQFVSVTPAFKATSLSTPARVAYNSDQMPRQKAH